jgi:hypothetical protein
VLVAFRAAAILWLRGPKSCIAPIDGPSIRPGRLDHAGATRAPRGRPPNHRPSPRLTPDPPGKVACGACVAPVAPARDDRSGEIKGSARAVMAARDRSRILTPSSPSGRTGTSPIPPQAGLGRGDNQAKQCPDWCGAQRGDSRLHLDLHQRREAVDCAAGGWPLEMGQPGERQTNPQASVRPQGRAGTAEAEVCTLA